MPAIGAEMVVSIFIASVTTKGSPLATCCPLFTRILTTEPERVAPISPGLVLSAFLRVILVDLIFLSFVRISS